MFLPPSFTLMSSSSAADLRYLLEVSFISEVIFGLDVTKTLKLSSFLTRLMYCCASLSLDLTLPIISNIFLFTITAVTSSSPSYLSKADCAKNTDGINARTTVIKNFFILVVFTYFVCTFYLDRPSKLLKSISPVSEIKTVSSPFLSPPSINISNSFTLEDELPDFI
ncbi:hypothetical protein D9M72_502650 [compost metagenome]